MTISEAKKIIDMCIDIVESKDEEKTKTYVNKGYVFQILDMVETPSSPYIGIKESPSNGKDLYPVDNYPFGWPKIYYRDSLGPVPSEREKFYPTDIYGNPIPYCGGDANSTGSKSQDANIVVTSAGLHKSNESHTDPEKIKNVTISSESSEPTHLFKEKFTTGAPVGDMTTGTDGLIKKVISTNNIS